MGHVASRFAPLDPDLEAENQLLDFVPQLMDDILRQVRREPQPQSISILTGRGYVEEILNGNNYSFRYYKAEQFNFFSPGHHVEGQSSASSQLT